MILNDTQIACLAQEGMITPYTPELVRKVQIMGLSDEYEFVKAISFGQSSYGYDLRLSPKDFRVFAPPDDMDIPVVDPKDPCEEFWHSEPLHHGEKGDYFLIPPFGYALGVAVECLDIPQDVTCLFIGKSTYARSGLLCNLTPGESGWKGHLTLELANLVNAYMKVYANEGICQALFFRGEQCETPYDDSRKYQNQPHSVVFGKV